MKINNLNIKNNINLKKINNNFSKKIFEDFHDIFLNIKRDLQSENKTLSVLKKKFSFNFKIYKLKKITKYKTIVIIGMGGSILGMRRIYNFQKKIKEKIYFLNDIDEKSLA